MNKSKLFFQSLFVAAFAVFSYAAGYAQSSNQFTQLEQISSLVDCSVRQEIRNNILINGYEDEEFKAILDSVSGTVVRSIDISEDAEEIYRLDTGRIEDITISEHKSNSLFAPIDESKIPDSYRWTIDLCNKFNPAKNTNDHKRLEKDIDSYLAKIENLPVIQHALTVTGTSIQDFRRNWFGEGRGFEHVIAGESSGSKVSGYHWWYRFYVDEINGNAVYQSSIEALNDPNIFTGKFTWDPAGPIKTCYKKKGGFIISESAVALLALGHIAIEAGRKNGSRDFRGNFWANINGTTYLWCMFTVNGTIRTLYPTASQSYLFPIED